VDEESANNHTAESAEAGDDSVAQKRPRSTTQKEANAFGGSLEEHPAFRRIVRHARRTFNAFTCMLSVIEEDQQCVLTLRLVYLNMCTYTLLLRLFLAETGLGAKGIPREISFCAHTSSFSLSLSLIFSPLVLTMTLQFWLETKALLCSIPTVTGVSVRVLSQQTLAFASMLVSPCFAPISPVSAILEKNTRSVHW
jgi:hypothetical protein